MCADVGKIPVNGHAESANEGLSDRSQVGLRGDDVYLAGCLSDDRL